jgi:hypothetical protein
MRQQITSDRHATDLQPADLQARTFAPSTSSMRNSLFQNHPPNETCFESIVSLPDGKRNDALLARIETGIASGPPGASRHGKAHGLLASILLTNEGLVNRLQLETHAGAGEEQVQSTLVLDATTAAAAAVTAFVAVNCNSICAVCALYKLRRELYRCLARVVHTCDAELRAYAMLLRTHCCGNPLTP